MITEAQLEAEALATLAELGYTHHAGLDIAPDGLRPQRQNYRQVVLEQPLRDAVRRPRTTPPRLRTRPFPW